MIGIPEEKLIGQKMLDLYPPDDAAVLKSRILQRQTAGHSQYEFYLPQANGDHLPVLVTARQIEDPDGNVFAVITATDITEQKRAENALREAERTARKAPPGNRRRPAARRPRATKPARPPDSPGVASTSPRTISPCARSAAISAWSHRGTIRSASSSATFPATASARLSSPIASTPKPCRRSNAASRSAR